MQSPGTTGDPASLDALHGLVVPDAVVWLPLAPGWWALMGIAALVLCAFAWRAWSRYRAATYRRAALAELSELQTQPADGPGELQRVVGQLGAVLKRVAMVSYSRGDVAAMSGDRWLEFLDRTGGTRAFSRGPGRRLCDLAYSARACLETDSAEIDALFGCVRGWIRDHDSEAAAC